MKKLLSLMTALVLALTLAAGGAAAEAAEKTAVREIATAEDLSLSLLPSACRIRLAY